MKPIKNFPVSIVLIDESKKQIKGDIYGDLVIHDDHKDSDIVVISHKHTGIGIIRLSNKNYHLYGEQYRSKKARQKLAIEIVSKFLSAKCYEINQETVEKLLAILKNYTSSILPRDKTLEYLASLK